jgi:uncharacterized MAPEG superfamily protein
MQTTMSTELYWLVMTTAMTAMMWVPYIVNRMAELGVLEALWDPFGHTEARAAWANRMMQAHLNAVENLIIFAPLVIVVHLLGLGNELTAKTCLIYFTARLVHYVAFTLAVPLLRVLSFLAGFYAQAVLALTVLQVI